jgi:hypothetical protein
MTFKLNSVIENNTLCIKVSDDFDSYIITYESSPIPMLNLQEFMEYINVAEHTYHQYADIVIMPMEFTFGPIIKKYEITLNRVVTPDCDIIHIMQDKILALERKIKILEYREPPLINILYAQNMMAEDFRMHRIAKFEMHNFKDIDYDELEKIVSRITIDEFIMADYVRSASVLDVKIYNVLMQIQT